MGSESILHEAEGRVGYRLGGHGDERNNCFSKIQLVELVKKILRLNIFPSKHYKYGGRFSLLVGYNI